MVKAVDCRSDEDVRAGSIPVIGNSFFLNDDGGTSRSGASVEASLKYKARGSEATENANAKHKA